MAKTYDPRIYPYTVTEYYGKNVKPPKIPGTLAIQTVHKNTTSANLDRDIGIKRDDIGLVTWSGPNYSGQWKEDDEPSNDTN